MEDLNTSFGLSVSGTGGFLEPERIVRYFDLEPGDFVADFGAGHGYFTLLVAKIVGDNGKVFAIDIQKPVLEVIKSKARLEHILNIETVWADLERPHGSKLRDDFIDFVIVANILFQTEDKKAVLAEAYRVLRTGKRMALIEWSAQEKTALGPPFNLRIKRETAQAIAEEVGFEFEREFEAGSHHYGLLFQKP